MSRMEIELTEPNDHQELDITWCKPIAGGTRFVVLELDLHGHHMLEITVNGVSTCHTIGLAQYPRK